MDSTTSGSSEITLSSPIISYTYAKLTDEKEFKQNSPPVFFYFFRLLSRRKLKLPIDKFAPL